ncbi:MAG: hypothetical protein NZ585_00535 [Chloracidobacterium sp.]|nr:hypothetical protein [Chloracidobacterium sp.]MDW8216507.1 hypothetical protein [Acidobacteriota bacterium]
MRKRIVQRGLCSLALLILTGGLGLGREPEPRAATREAARSALRITADDPRFFPLSAIKPGLVGVGRTVFQGDRVEEFGVEVLGVLPGVPNPKQSFVVARLTGANVERTLVFAGMSGSPVFIDGKLVGAVSAAFAFAKEPIALIMPIAHMIEVFAESDQPLAARRSGRFAPVLVDPAAVATIPALRDAARAGAVFTPIATPLAAAGFPVDVLTPFAPTFEELGFRIVSGGGAPAQPAALGVITPDTLSPGRTVSVDLMRGDFGLSASGTVTWRDGDDILAFGHSFFSPGGIGGVMFPMSEGEVVTVIPNIGNSFKLTVPKAPVGAMTQDRSAAIRGRLGVTAPMIPVTVEVKSALGAARRYHFEMVEDAFLSPILVNIGVAASLTATERSIGETTLRTEGRIELEGAPPVRFARAIVSNFSPATWVGFSVAQPLATLLNSGLANGKVRAIHVTVTARDARLNGVLEGLWADRLRVRRGENLNLTLLARDASGRDLVERVTVTIPTDAQPGPATLLVGDGRVMDTIDPVVVGAAHTLGQLSAALNRMHRPDRLYVRLYRSEAGAVIGDEAMPALPPSYLATVGSARVKTDGRPLSTLTLFKQELPPGEFDVTGRQQLDIEILP